MENIIDIRLKDMDSRIKNLGLEIGNLRRVNIEQNDELEFYRHRINELRSERQDLAQVCFIQSRQLTYIQGKLERLEEQLKKNEDD